VLRGLIEADVVEHEELNLRPEEHLVRDSQRSRESLGPAGDPAGITRVRGSSYRVGDVAEHGKGGVVEERIAKDRRRIRHQQHVALADLLEALHRRPVERESSPERVFVHHFRRDGQVLERSQQVDEFQVEKPDSVLADHLHDVARRGALVSAHQCPPVTTESADRARRSIC
jgi:hypothetical protein